MRNSRVLGFVLAVLALAGCGGGQAHVPLAGPGLHRVIAQDGQSALRFWWLPPTSQNPAARLLLWDGENVSISDPAATDQSFEPLKAAAGCDEVALAPDNHAFACATIEKPGNKLLVQSLDTLDAPAQSLLNASAPLAWSPDNQRLAALHLGDTNASASCSVMTLDTDLPELDETSEQVLLDNIPFITVGDTGTDVCPVMAMAWSPDDTRLALSLASSDGVVLEVLKLGAPGQPIAVESRHLLPGQPLQLVDTPAVPSLFWSPDGQTLAALTGYGAVSEDGLFLLALDQQTALTGPNLVDTGSGAALAFSPDGRWLAVGAVGTHTGGDNAQLRVFDVGGDHWDRVAPMFVNGGTLAWSADSALLAAASVSQQGEVIWNWSSARLNSIIPNQDSASLEQLGWAQDGSALFFALGAQGGGASPFEEVYAQSFPVPPGVISFAFPAWFLRVLDLLPQALLWFGAALLALIALALLLVLIERGRSPRRRALIVWALGVGIVLFGLLYLSYNRLPGWVTGFYQPLSTHLCQNAPNPCNPGAALALGTLASPLLLGGLVMLIGVLLTSRKRRPVPGEGLPRPTFRGPMSGLSQQDAQPEPPPLLLPAPIDQQDTQELDFPPMPVQEYAADEGDAQDWQS